MVPVTVSGEQFGERLVKLLTVIIYGCDVVVVVAEVGLAIPERVRVVPVVVNESPKSSPLGHTITALE
jgi:hypothetical protein